MKGKFIVIAGCEGSGKTTQIAFLKAKYPNAIFTREPGGTDFAENGPRYLMLKSPYAKDLNGYEHITQVFSGRSHHVRTLIAPALAENKIVFSDRFDCCSFAIQIYGMENTNLLGLFDSLRSSIEPQIVPDLYIILDVSPEESMRRTALRAQAKGDSNHFDERMHDFHARVRDGYKRFAARFPERVKIVDAHPSAETVWSSIEGLLKPLI
jgi:dTMP kinase